MVDGVDTKRCRICLSEKTSQLINWNNLLESEFFEDTTYLECFRECTNLDASAEDTLPQTICYNCAGQLHEAYLFIKRAKESHQMLIMEAQHGININRRDHKQANFEWVAVQKIDDKFLPKDLSPASALPTIAKVEFDEQSITKMEFDEQIIDNYKKPFDNDGLMKKDATEPNINVGENVIIQKRGRPKTNELDSITETQTINDKCDKACSSEECSIKRQKATKYKRQLMLCHACPRTFKDATTLRQHTETHEENRARNYTCEQCGSKFFTKTTFQNHAKTHEKNRKAAFQCDQCEKSFFHKGSLKLHMQHHTGATVECKICSKKYLRAVDLEIHLRSHSGDTPFKCPYCEKAFTQMGILNKHVRHHEGYRYKCDICLKEYLHQSTLIQHRKEHTGLPLKCSICGKGFVKKSKLKRHIGGVHKVKQSEEMEEFIVKVKTKREYRGRILETA